MEHAATPLHPLIFILLVCCINSGWAQRVYFGTSQSKGIYVAEFDAENGTLSDLRLAIETGRPNFVALHPDKPFLYAPAFGGELGRQGGVAAYRREKDGSLTLLNQQASEGRGACHVSVDRSGRCLTVAYYGSGSVASFGILDDGSLSKARSFHQHAGSADHPQRQQGPHAHAVVINPDNTFAYAPDLGIDEVVIYRLDAEAGTLTPAGSVPIPGPAMGPRHMKWAEDGQTAYVLNELDLSLSAFKPGKEPGSLKFLKTEPALPADTAGRDRLTCAEVRIHPNGKWIYASLRDLDEKGRDALIVFSRYEDGLKRLANVPAEVQVPRNFNMDPSGQWLLAGGQRSQDIAIFSIDSKTGIPAFTGRKIPFDGGPISIEFVPTD